MDFLMLDDYSIAMIFHFLDIESHWNLRQTCKRMKEIGSESYHKQTMEKQIQKQFVNDSYISQKNIWYSLKYLSQTVEMCQYIAENSGCTKIDTEDQEKITEPSKEEVVLRELLDRCLIEKEAYISRSDGVLAVFFGNHYPSFKFHEVRHWYTFTAGKGVHNHFYLFSTEENDVVWFVQMGLKKRIRFWDWTLSYFEWKVSRNSSTGEVEMIKTHESQRGFWKENVCERLTKYIYTIPEDQCKYKITPEILYEMGRKSWKDHDIQPSMNDDGNKKRFIVERKQSFWEAFKNLLPRELMNYLKYYVSLCWGYRFIDMLFDMASIIFQSMLESERYCSLWGKLKYQRLVKVLLYDLVIEKDQKTSLKNYILFIGIHEMKFSQKIESSSVSFIEIVLDHDNENIISLPFTETAFKAEVKPSFLDIFAELVKDNFTIEQQERIPEITSEFLYLLCRSFFVVTHRPRYSY